MKNGTIITASAVRMSMPQFRSIALAVLLAIGAATLSGRVASAGSPMPSQADTPAQAKTYAQEDPRGGELSIMPAQDPAPKLQDANPWAVTNPSGVHIQSRAGFVGYH
jgi:hypothetical protein